MVLWQERAQEHAQLPGWTGLGHGDQIQEGGGQVHTGAGQVTGAQTWHHGHCISLLSQILHVSQFSRIPKICKYNICHEWHILKLVLNQVTGTCALFLAGKAEETPKKCRDLIKNVRALTNDQQFSQFGKVRKEFVLLTIFWHFPVGSQGRSYDIRKSFASNNKVRSSSGSSLHINLEIWQEFERR